MTFPEGTRVEVNERCLVEDWIGKTGTVLYGNDYTTTLCMDEIVYGKSRVITLNHNNLIPLKIQNPTT